MTEHAHVEHADVVEHADHADNVGSIVVTTPARTRRDRVIQAGWTLTVGLLAGSVFSAVFYLAPAVDKLVDQNVDRDRDRANIQAALDAERAEDDLELLEERCENAYAREVDRRRDRVAATEAVTLRALAGDDNVFFDAALVDFEAASKNLTLAIADRDAYIAAGRPLPCPISADG